MARHRQLPHSNDLDALLSEVRSWESEGRLSVDDWSPRHDRVRVAMRAAAGQALNPPLGRPDVMDEPAV